MTKKPSLLARFIGTAPLNTLPLIELMNRRSAAEAEFAEAERDYRKAALDAEKGLDGALARKAEAAGVVRLAQERLRDVMAAQIEAEAEHAAQQLDVAHDAEKAADESHGAAWSDLEQEAKVIEDATAALAKAWVEFRAGYDTVLATMPKAPHGAPRELNLIGLLADEMARHAAFDDRGQAAVALPGASHAEGSIYLVSEIKPFSRNVTEVGDWWRNHLQQRERVRAKR